MAASNTPAQDDAQVDSTPSVPAAFGGGTAPASPVADAPVDVHLPDDNEAMVDLRIANRMPGDSFVTHLEGVESAQTPAGPMAVTVGTEATSVRETWADKIIADARAVGVTIERVVKDVAEKVEG